MKKLLLAASIAFLGSTAVMNSDLTDNKLEVQAKEKKYPISKNFAQNLKQGKLPRSKGKIGMSYKTLIKQKGIKLVVEKHVGGTSSYYDKSVLTKDNYVDYYGFDSKNLKVAKVVSIERKYGYSISQKSFKKYFNRPLRYVDASGYVGVTSYPTIYKSGKYYSSLEILGYRDDYFNPGSTLGINVSYVGVHTKKEALKLARTDNPIDFKR